jgi:hypothetical protein
MTHEKPATLIIGVVAGFGDPAIVGRQKVADFGHDADAVGARDDQPKSAH